MDQSSPAPAATPRTIRRLDYQPPEFRVTHLALDFDLEPNATIVKATLKLERAGSGKAPLVLDGRRVELLSVALDGVPVLPVDRGGATWRLTSLGGERVRHFNLDYVAAIDRSSGAPAPGSFQPPSIVAGSLGEVYWDFAPDGWTELNANLVRPPVLEHQNDNHRLAALLAIGVAAISGWIIGGISKMVRRKRHPASSPPVWDGSKRPSITAFSGRVRSSISSFMRTRPNCTARS